jgi:hypothetical protein
MSGIDNVRLKPPVTQERASANAEGNGAFKPEIVDMVKSALKDILSDGKADKGEIEKVLLQDGSGGSDRTTDAAAGGAATTPSATPTIPPQGAVGSGAADLAAGAAATTTPPTAPTTSPQGAAGSGAADLAAGAAATTTPPTAPATPPQGAPSGFATDSAASGFANDSAASGFANDSAASGAIASPTSAASGTIASPTTAPVGGDAVSNAIPTSGAAEPVAGGAVTTPPTMPAQPPVASTAMPPVAPPAAPTPPPAGADGGSDATTTPPTTSTTPPAGFDSAGLEAIIKQSKELIAQALGKPVEELTADDIISKFKELFDNMSPEQQQAMKAKYGDFMTNVDAAVQVAAELGAGGAGEGSSANAGGGADPAADGAGSGADPTADAASKGASDDGFSEQEVKDAKQSAADAAKKDVKDLTAEDVLSQNSELLDKLPDDVKQGLKERVGDFEKDADAAVKLIMVLKDANKEGLGIAKGSDDKSIEGLEKDDKGIFSKKGTEGAALLNYINDGVRPGKPAERPEDSMTSENT